LTILNLISAWWKLLHLCMVIWWRFRKAIIGCSRFQRYYTYLQSSYNVLCTTLHWWECKQIILASIFRTAKCVIKVKLCWTFIYNKSYSHTQINITGSCHNEWLKSHAAFCQLTLILLISIIKFQYTYLQNMLWMRILYVHPGSVQVVDAPCSMTKSNQFIQKWTVLEIFSCMHSGSVCNINV